AITRTVREGSGRPGGRVATCPGRVGVRLPSASVMAPAESGVAAGEGGPGAGSAEGATGTGGTGRRAGWVAGRARGRRLRERQGGMGRGRRVGEVAARARDRGFKVVWGRCWEAGGAPAYWPWVQALRALVRGVGSEELRSQLGAGTAFVAQIVAELAEILPEV